jgi:hypothetical protein
MTERQVDFIAIAVPLMAEIVCVLLFFAAAIVWCCIGAGA